MTSRSIQSVLLLAAVACLLLLLPANAAHAQASSAAAAGQPEITPQPQPSGIAYWRHGETEERVEWGAAGIEIDQWDTQDHGIWHDNLLWYRYRLLYPDGSTYAIGYDWIERDSPDETLKPGRFATHNWPVASPESLLEFDFVAVEKADEAGDRDSFVDSYTRWYPSPPAMRGNGTGSPWAAYADQRLGLRASSPFAQSRRQQAVHAYIRHTNDWDRYWGGVQVQAARDSNTQIELARMLEAQDGLAVDYLGELRERLGSDDRYRGSAIETFGDELKTDAKTMFAGVEDRPELVERMHDEQAGRIPERLFGGAPIIDPRASVQAEEMAASLARRLDPLRSEADLVRRYDADNIDVQLGLWSAGESFDGDPRQRGPLGGSSGSGVMLVSSGEARVAVNEVEASARAIEQGTRFANVSADGEILSFAPASERAAFALVSDAGAGSERGTIVRGYQSASGSLDVRELLVGAATDELDELDPIAEVVALEQAMRLGAEGNWRGISQVVAESTGHQAEALRMPLPARRAGAAAVWQDYLDARSRE